MWQVINGNNIDVLKTYSDDTFDSIVTDPPYGIAFLGKDWDNNTGALETWQECFRVLKPGGHLLAFSAARTYHHLATNIEMSGFEIRDQLMWLYSSGFPKAQDIGKALDKRGVENDLHGWKTSLKPAHEPIVMARKPFSGSATDNVLEHGVGALNIDASRINFTNPDDIAEYKNNLAGPLERSTANNGDALGMFNGGTGFKAMKGSSVEDHMPEGRFPSNVLGEVQDYQKYFYCPKVSRAERHAGFDKNSTGAMIDANTHGKTPLCLDCNKTFNGTTNHSKCDPNKKTFVERRNNYTQDGTLGRMKDKMHQPNVGNNHPTVKPVQLMKYLVRLVTPIGGKVLDPFNGSGSTGMACVELKCDYTGIDLDENYVEIAQKRISAWEKRFDTPKHNLFD